MRHDPLSDPMMESHARDLERRLSQAEEAATQAERRAVRAEHELRSLRQAIGAPEGLWRFLRAQFARVMAQRNDLADRLLAHRESIAKSNQIDQLQEDRLDQGKSIDRDEG